MAMRGWLGLCVALWGCAPAADEAAVDPLGGDAQAQDAQPLDARIPDAQAPDAQALDAHTPDAQAEDAQAEDAQAEDAQVEDADAPDAQAEDAQVEDAQALDAHTPDAQAEDAQPLDADTPDAQAEDAQPLDAGPLDAARADAAGTCAPGRWGPGCAQRCACDDGLFCNGAEICDPQVGCVAGPPPEAPDDGDPCTVVLGCRDDLGAFETGPALHLPACGPQPAVPTQAPQDYAFWYWPSNHRPRETWPTPERELHVRTGVYGLTFDEATGSLGRLGVLADPGDLYAAQVAPREDLQALPGATLRWHAGAGAVHLTATEFLGAEGNPTARARLVEGGRFFNRLDVPTVRYADGPTYAGAIELASMARHVVFTHTVSASTWDPATPAFAQVELSGAALEGLDVVDWLVPERAVQLTDADGQGWVFVVYDVEGRTTRLTYEAGVLVAERQGAVGPDEPLSVSLLAAPTAGLSAHALAMYLHPQDTVSVGYTLLDRDGAPVGDQPVAWDERLGAFRVPLQPLQAAGAPRWPDYEQADHHTWYGRHQLRVDTGGLPPLSVPLALFGPERITFYITGGAFLTRDAAGEPLGLPVQISKNWHDRAAGNWYHLFMQPTVAGDAPAAFELTAVSSRWGPTYAASHAQLSLVGWNAAVGGHWEESALGAFGESVTYDPDETANRSMVDDVRPFLVQANRRWSWTGNVGGADFLRYTTADAPGLLRRLGQVRTLHAANGPLLTDVIYAGRSSDGRIAGRVRVRLGGTNDVVRVYYQLEYTFLEDVTYDRLAFFQMAADNYGDNGFTRYALGDADGVRVDAAIEAHGTTGYADDGARGIPLPGEAPWVLLYANAWADGDLPEHLANVGYVVRDFEAVVGDTVLRTPHINLHRTNNRSSQYGIELGLPDAPDAAWCGAPCQGRRRFVPAGSTVRATVEYLVPPADRDRYYGDSDTLLAQPAEAFAGTGLMRDLAAGNALQVDVAVGTLRTAQPVTVDAAPGAVAAQLTLTGGRGDTPITVRGLVRHDGWRLEQAVDGGWVPLDRAVHGHDGWQADRQPDGTWALTWPVRNRAPTGYRVVWVPVAERAAP